MNSKIRIALAGAACVVGCAIGFAQTPTADSQIPGAAPSQGYVWMSGHWNSEGGQWKWVAAHWDLPPSRSATWVGGHWISSSGSWVWVNGAWNVSDAAQAQAGPPQPPGQYAPGSVPSPSTPAPYVDGQYQNQYGPGGVSRSVDPNAAATDSGTVDYPAGYSVDYGYPGYVYPAYYGWSGDPWFWGFPAFALGFGFGHGFHGGGFHGGGFRGGHGGFGHAGFAAHGAGGHFGR